MAEENAAVTLETPLDASAFGDEYSGLFGEGGVANMGDLLSRAASAGQAGEAKPAAIGLDTELDVSIFDEDVQRALSARKVNTLGAMADWARNAEKLVGADVVKKPVAGELPKWFAENGEVLGVPKEMSEYKFELPDLPEGMSWDEGFERKAQEYAMERSLPAEIHRDLADFVIQDRIEQFQAQAGQEAARAQELKDTLTKDWGRDVEKNTEIAQLAARELGIEGPIVDQLDKELGSPGLMILFHKIGAKMVDASLVAGDGAALAGSKAEAQARVDALDTDEAFQKRLNDRTANGHKEAVAEYEALMKKLHGGG